MNWKDEALQILSLTPTETAILNSLKEAKSVQDIARSTSLSRTGINYAIKNLTRKGLIKVETRGKRSFYIALKSEEFSEMLQQALMEVERDYKTKKGAKIKLSKVDEFIIHVGAKEIIPAYRRIAFENKNERVRAIQHHRSWNNLIEKISPKQLVQFNEAIKENNIILDAMLNRGAYDAYREEIKNNPKKNIEAVKSLEGRMADYAVFDDNFFNHDAEIWIFKTTTLIINWQEEVAIEITNANITGFLKDMFEFVKAGGRKFDHNKTIRELLQ